MRYPIISLKKKIVHFGLTSCDVLHMGLIFQTQVLQRKPSKMEETY